MKRIKNNGLIFLLLAAWVSLYSCQNSAAHETKSPNSDWKQRFAEILPLLGHRNWIVVADKALPWQTAQGIEYINTNEKLLPVLEYVLKQVNASGHVKPIIYRDKEFSYMDEGWVQGVDQFTKTAGKMLAQQTVQSIMHDSVFTRLDEASRQFKVLVLKTDEVIPYTSVFMQLDCAYWNSEKESWLRNKMKNN